MIVIFFRTLITFTVLLTVMRLMGKRQIGEMQPFEFVITLLIAELACLPLADVSIPLVYGTCGVRSASNNIGARAIRTSLQKDFQR